MNPRTSTILFNSYIAGAGFYIIGNAYLDAKRMVENYRNNQLDDYEYKRYKTEVEAVRTGMFVNMPLYLITAFAWPISGPVMAIPYIITNNSGEKKIKLPP